MKQKAENLEKSKDQAIQEQAKIDELIAQHKIEIDSLNKKHFIFQTFHFFGLCVCLMIITK